MVEVPLLGGFTRETQKKVHKKVQGGQGMKLNSSFKRALAYTLSVALVLTSISFDDSYLLKAKAETATGSQSQSAGATAISAIVDNDSTYIPTSLINGGFDSEPWMKYENEEGMTVLSVNKLEVTNKKIKES